VIANQFYIPRILQAADRIVLEGVEHRHLAKAVRVRPGEIARLFDALGRPILRAETAALADAAMIMHFWNE
jgi:16S rRNA U1498 N3-methylase RsmE